MLVRSVMLCKRRGTAWTGEVLPAAFGLVLLAQGCVVLCHKIVGSMAKADFHAS